MIRPLEFPLKMPMMLELTKRRILAPALWRSLYRRALSIVFTVWSARGPVLQGNSTQAKVPVSIFDSFKLSLCPTISPSFARLAAPERSSGRGFAWPK
jgi:hypothetical protein